MRIKLRLLSYFGVTLLCSLIFSCLSLDPFLFKDQKVDAYLLDEYTGFRECASAIEFLKDSVQPVIDEISLMSGGETIYGLLLRHDTTEITQNDTLILYFHGTSDHIDRYWPRTKLLFATGFPVFVIDYRGYGKSTGEPTEEGCNEDGKQALAYIASNLNNPRVILYAFSLGSLPGCAVAAADAKGQIKQLVLEAPIGSVATLVQDASYLNLPGSFVTTFTGNNAERIKSVSIPLFWIHGTKDETLNRETNGLPIWQNHPGKKGYYIIAHESTHRENPITIGYSRYIKCLRDFIRDNSPKDPIMISK